tara:strand:- start:1048 stop:2259 length:1212 start_codon:yes stop_codon:yes gene_type:complete
MGEMDIKSGNLTDRAGGDIDVCSFPGENNCITQKELEFFNTTEGKKLLRKQGAQVVEQDLIDKGVDVNEARKTANKVTGNNELLSSEIVEGIQTSLKDEQEQAKEGATGTRKSFGTWKYPTTLNAEEQDVIQFTALEYVPKGFKADAGNLNFFDNEKRGPLENRAPRGTVTLPIPGDINDTNAVDWGEDSMTALDAALANIGLEFLTGTDLAGEIGKTAEGVRRNKSAVKEALSSAVVSAATGSTGQALLTRATGNIMNPNMELLFKKPQLRPFNFKFKLSPRSKKEAEQVIGIIRFFKQSMAPIRSKSQLFLKTPHTYRLKYIYKNQNNEAHPFLNLFKECALMNLSINYTPDGSYTTYEDGVMTAYEMTMQFTEIEPIFNDDYETSDGQSSAVTAFKNIGY